MEEKNLIETREIREKYPNIDIQKQTRTGNIKAKKIGIRYYVEKAEFIKFLEKNK